MFRLLVILTLTLACGLTFSAGGALAQFDDLREVRTTNGLTHMSGWERDLIRRDPSLRHWTWLPIASYKQGRAMVGPEYRGLPNRQTFYGAPYCSPESPSQSRQVYNKPVHVSTRISKASYGCVVPDLNMKSNIDYKQAYISYNQPSARDEVYGILNANRNRVTANIHAPRKDAIGKLYSKRYARPSVDIKLASRDLQGQLSSIKPLAASPMGTLKVSPIATYGDVHGHLVHKEVGGLLVNREVAATLLSQRELKEVFGRIKL